MVDVLVPKTCEKCPGAMVQLMADILVSMQRSTSHAMTPTETFTVILNEVPVGTERTLNVSLLISVVFDSTLELTHVRFLDGPRGKSCMLAPRDRSGAFVAWPEALAWTRYMALLIS